MRRELSRSHEWLRLHRRVAAGNLLTSADMRVICALAVSLCLLAQEVSQSGLVLKAARPMVSQPERAPKAMVASAHELASQAGLEILRKGGNAVDAAVAVGFALAVVHPEAGNLGGGGYMLIRMADGKTHFVDYRERAPEAASANMYLDVQGNVVGDASIVGYRAIAVPGSVEGMVYAEKKYGKLSLERVM